MLQYFKSDIELGGQKKPNIPLRVILVLVFIYFVYSKFIFFDNTVLHNVDMKPFSEPIQQVLTPEDPTVFKMDDNGSKSFVTPLAKYKIYGRLYTKHYVPAKMSLGAIIPYDMGIGWAKMADKSLFNKIKMKYALFDRVVYWRFDSDCPLDYYEINSSFSNNHIIPANKRVRKGLDKLQKKDVVYLEGYLVKVSIHRRDGRHEVSQSSLTRTDEGLGACEMIYVTRVVSRHGDYK